MSYFTPDVVGRVCTRSPVGAIVAPSGESRGRGQPKYQRRWRLRRSLSEALVEWLQTKRGM